MGTTPRDGLVFDLGTAHVEVIRDHRTWPCQVGLPELEAALIGYADVAQGKWVRWRRKLKLDQLPVEFAEVLADCIEFSDPALRDEVTGKMWDPSTRTWS